MKISVLALSISAAVIFSVSTSGETKIRVGHFPNITRAQGVIARAL
jgi:hypothetical protein